jgi:transposase
MLSRHDITDAHWQRIEHLLPGRAGQHGGVGADNRLFINAIRYLAKTGIAWADLPTCYGKPNSLWQRYNRWCQRGVWAKIAAELRDDDTEWLSVDTTCVRANVAAAEKKADGTGGQATEALGRSRGGFGSKIHAVVAPFGHPIVLKLTGAEAADSPHLPGLIAGLKTEAVLADKGYDSDANRTAIRAQGAEPCIPPRSNRKAVIPYDRHLYKERNVVERFFGRIKQYRRVATRFDKKAANYLGFVWLASIGIMLA